MRESKTFAGLFVALLIVAALHSPASAQLQSPGPPPPPPGWLLKVDPLVQAASQLSGNSKVVVRAIDAASLDLVRTAIQLAGGTLGLALPIIDGQAADVPNASLPALAGNSLVQHVSLDRLTLGLMERTSATVGATAVRQDFGLDGSGVGVAIIDSGVTPSHDDLIDPGQKVRVTVIARSAAGLEWIEWQGDDTGDPVLDDNHRYDGCDGRTECASGCQLRLRGHAGGVAILPQ